MGYNIDLEKIDIDEYKKKLEVADLLPSRRLLKNDIDTIFNRIKAHDIRDVEELLNAINSKDKVQRLSKTIGVDENYMTILARELKCYKRKPNRLKDFPGVPDNTLKALENIGVKNTFHLYEKVLTSKSRTELAKQLGIEPGQITRLSKLSDLSRIRWVNHTFAYILYEAGYETAQKVAYTDPRELYDKIKQLNEERKIYKGNIGLHDMKLCIDYARELSFEIET